MSSFRRRSFRGFWPMLPTFGCTFALCSSFLYVVAAVFVFLGTLPLGAMTCVMQCGPLVCCASSLIILHTSISRRTERVRSWILFHARCSRYRWSVVLSNGSRSVCRRSLSGPQPMLPTRTSFIPQDFNYDVCAASLFVSTCRTKVRRSCGVLHPIHL